jgi:hypothetical protein
MPEQVQGRPRRPVEIVEHEEHRRALGHRGQESDHGFEHEVLIERRIRACRRRYVPDELGELGQQARKLRGAATRLLSQQGGRTDRYVGAQRLDEGLKGEADVLVAAPVEDDGAVAVGAPGELPDQARLPDPRLTGDQGDAASTAAGLAPRLADRLELDLATDEGHALDRREGDGER